MAFIKGIAKGAHTALKGIAKIPKSRVSLWSGLVIGGTTVVGGAAIKGIGKWRENVLKGLYPGSALPSESGRFGIRTNRNQAGISGLRFNFRRK